MFPAVCFAPFSREWQIGFYSQIVDRRELRIVDIEFKRPCPALL